MFNSNPMNNISNRTWYRKTKPYRPSHVINCFKIKIRLCHLGFRKAMGIPLGQQVDLRETMNKLHGTSSILAFLNHFSPFNGSPVARAYEIFCYFQLHIPDLGPKTIKCLCKGLCNREVVAFEFPEEDIPTMSLQVIYGIIMGKKGLETIRLDSNHRGHGHCEIDTMDITGGRFRLPKDE
jgi:hypothetical protein